MCCFTLPRGCRPAGRDDANANHRGLLISLSTRCKTHSGPHLADLRFHLGCSMASPGLFFMLMLGTIRMQFSKPKQHQNVKLGGLYPLKTTSL